MSISTLIAQAPEGLMGVQMDVVVLSSDLMEGRSTGTKGAELARNYIANRFKEIGLSPKGENNSFFHSFEFKYKKNPHAAGEGEKRVGKNVVGLIDNGAKHTVVIGAHYDHLGWGDAGSLYTGEPAIHNGADDNASGVAAILNVAEALTQSDAKNNNYLFIAFSGEEMGLYGSKNFTLSPTIDLEKVNYMLNLDMVGRLKEDKTMALGGVGTCPEWRDEIEDVKTSLKFNMTESGIGPSDHASFYLKDIPVLFLFTGQHSDYHKPSDDSHLINYDGILEISDFVIELIEEVDDEGKLKFTKTKNEEKGRKAASFKVSLGVMPDYIYQGEGMRIDGVTDGRPAAIGGLEGGDIIIKIGDTEVKDIYDYMEGLAKYNLGDKAQVVVKRKDKVIVRDVTF